MESNQSLYLNKEWLYQKYIVEGLSTYQIAEIVKRNPKNIYNKLKDFGIQTRTRAETVQQNAWWKLGRQHWNKGKRISDATKEKISKSRTGTGINSSTAFIKSRIVLQSGLLGSPPDCIAFKALPLIIGVLSPG